MPATEETYRSQPTLHLVFAISSIAMLLATVWMVMADHLRPWKQVQRQFQEVERDKLKAAEAEKLAEQNTKLKAELDQKDQEIAAAESEARTADRAGEIRDIDKKLRMLEGSAEDLDTKRRFQKVDLDSKRSLYDGMIDRGEERQARTYLGTVVRDSQRDFDGLSLDLEKANKNVKDMKADREKLLGFVDNLKKDKERLTREADRVRRVIEQKDALYGGPLHWYSRPMAFLRSLPGIDLMPPTKIQQISLPELTINYNFKEVPRYDRWRRYAEGVQVAPIPHCGRDHC
jgi:hypothetical protein